MRYHKSRIFFLMLCILFGGTVFSQDTTQTSQDTSKRQDVTPIVQDTTKPMMPVDSLPKVATRISNVNRVDSVLKHHSPRTAALRSALVPGWGQIYNKKYWKLPIVYGALGISGAIFNYNLKWYRKTRFAYKTLVNKDTQNYGRIDPLLKPTFDRGEAQALRSYRDELLVRINYVP